MTCIECWSTSSTKSLNRSYEWNRDSHSRNHIHHSALPDTLFPCDGGEDLMEGLSTQACVGRGVCGWSQCCRARVFIGGYIEAATQVTQMRVLKYSHLSDPGGGRGAKRMKSRDAKRIMNFAACSKLFLRTQIFMKMCCGKKSAPSGSLASNVSVSSKSSLRPHMTTAVFLRVAPALERLPSTKDWWSACCAYILPTPVCCARSF